MDNAIMNERKQSRLRLLLTALAIVAAAQAGSTQSLSFSRGQNASPGFEGWEENADGSFNFVFGYMNRNWEEELNVPIGADNNIEPGGPDQGQPTHLLPRRNRFIFKVRVPKDFGTKEMIWTLTTQGKTEKAYATLRIDSKLDEVVEASETGALGAGTSSPEVRANKRPVVTIEGAKTRSVRVGQPLELTASVVDDGIPKPRARGQAGALTRAPQTTNVVVPEGVNPAYVPPRRSTVGKSVGLHLGWYLYRGAGAVVFDPPQIKVWEDTRSGANSPWAPLWVAPPVPPDGKWMSHVTFETPGTYVLRARADDGALAADQELTVTVMP
ncbi:MAG: hypothetical protein A3H97_04925 [Acidobacteria bacterium RIFCSPLOWO2_02_FULL_65_29]|nr:MAG: hypothetical protein A3H97_04925 [Acidobacteria bacterium RIFCSPLOWO2_02_FULL_65_29]